MATKLLLIKDVDSLGRSGEIVSVKPGYARNFLLPEGLGVIADKKALHLQESLKKKRAEQALVDKEEAEEAAARIQGLTISKVVKVDHDGHMYGSVTAAEITHLLLEEHKVDLDKKSIQLKHPIKATGVHEITVKMKEGVTATFHLKVMSEEGHRAALAEQEKAE